MTERKVFIFKSDPEILNIIKDIRKRSIDAANRDAYMPPCLYQPTSFYCRAYLTSADLAELAAEPWHALVSDGGLLYSMPINNDHPISVAWKEANKDSILIDDVQATDEQRYNHWFGLLGMTLPEQQSMLSRFINWMRS